MTTSNSVYPLALRPLAELGVHPIVLLGGCFAFIGDTVPIVFPIASDPVGAGLVESLARPGGNATGFMSFEYTLSGKWLELLKDIAPGVTRVAVLQDPTQGGGSSAFAVIQAAAPSLGVEVTPVNLRDAPEIERALADFARNATISYQKGLIILEFEREARNLVEALISAAGNVHRAGAKVEHIEPDYLVNVSDIARRAHISRAAVSLFAKGTRRKDFPAPVARVMTDSPLWDWVEIARWMYRKRTISRSVVVEAKIVRAANRALEETDGFEKAIFAKKLKAELNEEEFA